MSDPDPRSVLDDLTRRRRVCTSAIVTLATFYQLDPAPWLKDAAGGPGAAPSVRPEAPKTRRRPSPRGDTARPMPAPSARLLTALKDGPQRPGDLARAVGVTPAGLRKIVRTLVAKGLVQTTGTTKDRRIALP